MAKQKIQTDNNKLLGVMLIATGLFIAGYLASRSKFTDRAPILSLILIISIIIPSYRAVILEKGRKYGAIILASLGLFSFLVATLALRKAVPFGHVQYSDILGNYWFHLPWLAIIGYPAVLLLAYWLARFTSKATNKKDAKSQIFSYLRAASKTAVFTVLMSLVIDTAAIRANYWHWNEVVTIRFSRVPIIDFAGWIIIGFVAGLLIHYLFTRNNNNKVPSAMIAVSGLAGLWFWTCLNNWGGDLVPGIIGLVLTYLFGYYVLILSEKRK